LIFSIELELIKKLEGKTNMFLFYYFLAGSMTGSGHNANDDCALCRAWTKKQAINKFKKLYVSVSEENVSRVRYNQFGIAVLSDY